MIEKYEEKALTIVDKMIVNTSSKQEVMKYFNKLTIHDVVGNNNYKSMRAIARQYDDEGEQKVTNCLKVLLIDFSTAFEKRWSESKALDTAVELYYSEYSYLTLEDVFVLLKIIKESDFSFTPASFSKHLKKYAEKRFEVAERISMNEHLANKFTDISPRSKEAEAVKFKEAMAEYMKQSKKA